MMPLPPDSLLGMQRPKDAFVTGRVQIDADGQVTSVEIFQQVPEGRGLDKMFEKSMMKWTFAPASVSEFCSSITVNFDAKKSEIDSNEPWADVDYPPSPKPTEAEPLAYPPDAYAAGIGGTVTLFIEISPTGGLRKAVVREEAPQGQLFGAAALEGVQTWRFDGATPGRYRLKVRFKPDPANAPAEPPVK
jgi:TonB family protein